MKKFLPLVILIIGVAVLVGAFLLFKGKKADEPIPEETAPEIPFDQRPQTSLTPTSDGHWLQLAIKNIQVEAVSLDYELLYSLPDGRTQGVPGTVKYQKGETIERKLLLGSESSGKFRYDEGVTRGTLTLKFRNELGKLAGKLSTDFHLQSRTAELTSGDGQFKYIFTKIQEKDYFVVMNTFGASQVLPGLTGGPYGAFGSNTTALPGKVELSGNIYQLTGDQWEKLTDGKTDNLGIFAASAE